MYYTNVLPPASSTSDLLLNASNMASYPLPPSPAVVMPPQQLQQPVSWMHTIPSYMPWSVHQRQGNENVMKFTAESSNMAESNKVLDAQPTTSFEELPQSQFHRTIFQYKRKGSHLDDAPLPNKLYVSEDKMVARLNELHISNSYECSTLSTNQETSCSQPPRQPVRSLEELEGRLALDIDEVDEGPTPSSTNEAVIVLSPELQRLQKANNILPSSILEKIQKPSMELVLWKPPGGIVDSLIKAVANKSTESLRNADRPRKSVNSRSNNNNNNNLNNNDNTSGQTVVGNCPRAFNERLNNSVAVAPSTPSSVLTTHNTLLEGNDDDDMEL